MKVVDLMWWSNGKCPGLTAKGHYTGRYASSSGKIFYFIKGSIYNENGGHFTPKEYYEYIEAQEILNSTPVTLTF